MKDKVITQEIVEEFSAHLKEDEKRKNTVEKYVRDVRSFIEYIDGAEATKEAVIAYKNKLMSENYAPKSINSMLA